MLFVSICSFLFFFSQCVNELPQSVEPMGSRETNSDSRIQDEYKSVDQSTDMKVEPRLSERPRENENNIEILGDLRNNSIPSRFLFLSRFCNEKQTECDSISYYIKTYNGILVSKRTKIIYSSGSFDTIYETIKYDMKGNRIFSYKTKNRISRVYFILMKNKYAEVSIGRSHGNDKLYYTIAIRDLYTGKVTPGFGQRYVEQEKVVINHIAFDDSLERIVFVSGSKTIISNSIESNKPEWSYDASASIVCSPTIDFNSNIYFCLDNGDIIALSSYGRLLWKKNIGYSNSYKSYLSLDDSGQIIFANGFLVSMFDKFGKQLWSKQGLYETPAFIDKKNQIWVGSRGSLFAFSGNGKFLYKATIPAAKIIIMPIFIENSFLMLSSSLYQFSSEGKELQKWKIEGISLYYEENQIYTSNGKVYAIATTTEGGMKKQGVVEIDLGLPPLSTKGWPTEHGNFQQNRKKK